MSDSTQIQNTSSPDTLVPLAPALSSPGSFVALRKKTSQDSSTISSQSGKLSKKSPATVWRDQYPRRKYRVQADSKTDEIIIDKTGKIDTFALSQRQARFLGAYRRANGVITTAGRNSGISRDIYYRWMKENKTFAALIEREREGINDYVDSKLFQLIDKGNINAISLWKKANDPKYSERVNIAGKLQLSPSWYDEDRGKKEVIDAGTLSGRLHQNQLTALDKAIGKESVEQIVANIKKIDKGDKGEDDRPPEV